MLGLGMMSLTALGFMQFSEMQANNQRVAESSMEMGQLMGHANYAFQARSACINTFDGKIIGDTITEVKDRNKKVLFDTSYNVSHLGIVEMKVVNIDVPVPYADKATGNVNLEVTFEKKLKKPVRVMKRFPFFVTVNKHGAIIDCYSADTALKEELCEDLNGKLVNGKCESSIVMCANEVGEKGIKDTVSGSYGTKTESFIRYYSSGNPYKTMKLPGCGKGDVSDSAFQSCIGFVYLDEYGKGGGPDAWTSCGNTGGSWPKTTNELVEGHNCTLSEQGNIEWCGKGGSDGSYGIYTCGKELSKYIFIKNCDKPQT